MEFSTSGVTTQFGGQQFTVPSSQVSFEIGETNFSLDAYGPKQQGDTQFSRKARGSLEVRITINQGEGLQTSYTSVISAEEFTDENTGAHLGPITKEEKENLESKLWHEKLPLAMIIKEVSHFARVQLTIKPGSLTIQPLF